MPETEWTEQVADSPKKGIPMWVWGCTGCGVLVMVILLIGLGWGIGTLRDVIDPEKVWPNIEAVLPFDERPEGYQAMAMDFGELEFYGMISESKGIGAALYLFEENDGQEMDELFSGEGMEQASQFGVGGVEDAEPVTLSIDGRDCRAVRFKAAKTQFNFGNSKQRSMDSWILLIDLTGDSGFRMLQVFDFRELLDPESEDSEDKQELSPQASGQELIDLFIEPFSPWD